MAVYLMALQRLLMARRHHRSRSRRDTGTRRCNTACAAKSPLQEQLTQLGRHGTRFKLQFTAYTSLVSGKSQLGLLAPATLVFLLACYRLQRSLVLSPSSCSPHLSV